MTTAAASTAGSRARPISPYKGLAPFEDSELDALLFFGRERDREIVAANLVAARLTILYGPSGVGKSSLLRAGVARDLRALPESPAVVVHDTWTSEPLAALDEAVAAAGGVQATGSVVDTIALAAAVRGEVFLVLDQIEEYFLYHAPDRGPGTFEATLADIIGRPELAVHVLIGVREDALARLDAFKSRIPGLFANSLRLDRLDREAGRRAIEGPVARFGELVPEEEGLAIEAGLVVAVLDGVRAGEVVQGAKGRGAKRADAVRIETPYLQLVMQRLWEVERAAGSRVLRLATLERLGGAGRIVEEHLERALAALTERQKAMAARMFDHLVTPSGTKIAHGAGDLALYAAASEQEVDPVIQALGRERILRTIRDGESGAHEIYHDVLADAVLAWRARFEAEQALQQERADAERRHRRLLALVGASAIALAAMAGITIYALTQRSTARHQTALALVQKQAAELARRDAVTAQKLAEKRRKRALALVLIAQHQRKRAEEAQKNAQVSEKQAQDSEKKAQESEKQAKAAQTEAEQSAKDAEAAKRSAQASAQSEAAARQRAEASKQVAVRAAASARRSRQRAQRDKHLAVLASRKAKKSAKEARHEAELAKGRELAALALALVPTDPAQAVRRALEASVYERTARTEGVLRTAILALNVRAVLPGGGGPIRSMALSQDGRLLVTGSDLGGARIFDVRTGRLLGVLGNGTRTVTVALSPDERFIATGGSGNVARIWSRDTGKLLYTLRHGGGVRTVDFSPDGRELVTASADATARVFDVATGDQLLILPHPNPVRLARFSPDGRFVLTVGGETNAARIYDASSGEQVASLGHPGEVLTAAFSPDGKLVATAGRRNVRLWRTSDWHMTYELTGHTFTINQVAFSSDGSLVASASSDGTGRVWRTDTGQFVNLLTGHTSPVEAIAFAPDGAGIATGSSDKQARMTTGPLGGPSLVFAGHRDTVTGLVFTPDGGKLVTISSDGDARIFTTRVDVQLRLLGRQTDAVDTVAYSHDGRLVLSAGLDGVARLRTPAGKLVRSFDEGSPIVTSQLSRSGALLLTAGSDGTARLWDARTGKPEQTFEHGGTTRAAALSSDGRRVATAGDDGRLRLWDAASGGLIATRVHGGPVTEVAFSRDGKLLATGSDDSIVRLFRAGDGRLLHAFRGQTGTIASLDFSPDGKRLASAGAGADTTAWIWDLAGGRALTLVGHDAPLTTVRWSPDGRFLLTAGVDGDVRTWRASDGRQLRVLRGHVAIVSDVAWSADGRWIATAGPGAAGLWRSTTGEHLFFLRGHEGALRSIAFAPHGESLVTGGVDGTVRTYTCSICGDLPQLRHIAKARLRALTLASEAARGPH